MKRILILLACLCLTAPVASEAKDKNDKHAKKLRRVEHKVEKAEAKVEQTARKGWRKTKRFVCHRQRIAPNLHRPIATAHVPFLPEDLSKGCHGSHIQ